MDPRTQAMADLLVTYSVAAKKGDWAVIQSSPLGEPLVDACTRALLRAGANVTHQWQMESIQETVLCESSDEQLSFLSPIAPLIYEQATVLITIYAPQNTRALSNVDPRRVALQQKAREPILETYFRRMDSGELRWTLAVQPTNAGAQDANMSLHDYENFVYRAGLLEEPDPVAAWHGLAERQQRIIDWLQDKDTIHVTGPGTDLTLSVAGRTWINDDGHYNFPGGEVFTGPIEDSVQGRVQFSYPAFLAGREVSGVHLTFRDGVVVDAGASGDEAFLHEMLAMDEGARRLGEFAIGTNPGIQQFTKNTLFDEKIGGTLHMALGRSIAMTGGTNKSSLHWDMVYNLREGAEITANGQILSRNGEFVI